ncbi:MAG: glycoside hydrolase, partial [Bacteroides sp. SM1_62]
KLSQDGKRLLDNGMLIYKDISQPTVEGPKFMKKDGFYYILAPAGGVPEGWQTVLRSKNIYGPYEASIVLHQGNTGINGPHQGGLVELESGQWWFLHFQDRGLYGRIVHLQPVSWQDGWPMIGVDINDDGIGEPVMEYKKPDVGEQYPVEVPQTSDEFNGPELGFQWQWHANPQAEWYSLTENPGTLRLHSVKNVTQGGNLWFVPNLLLQKFPMPSFTVTTKIDGSKLEEGDRCGLVIMGREWGYLSISRSEGQFRLGMFEGSLNRCSDQTENIESVNLLSGTCYLRVFVNTNGICHFSYSLDNESYSYLGREFGAEAGVWIGAKAGLFCFHPNIAESSGFADVDWFRITE